MKRQTTAVIAEGHEGLRETLLGVLTRTLAVQVTHVAPALADAVSLVLATHPDLAIIDAELPGGDSLKAIVVLRQGAPRTRLVLTAAHFERVDAMRALHAGIEAHILKSASEAEIHGTLKTLLSAEGTHPRQPSGTTAAALIRCGRRSGVTSPIVSLSARELEVLACVGRGLSTKEIARTLHVSVKTVDRHKANLMNKLNIHDRVQLSLCAVRQGLISPWSDERIH